MPARPVKSTSSLFAIRRSSSGWATLQCRAVTCRLLVTSKNQPEAPMTVIDDLQSIIGRVSERVTPSVVRIGRHGGRGCGVVVGDGLVLTNAHNLRARTTLVTFPDGRSVQSRAVGVDVETDLVVLAVDTGGGPAPGRGGGARRLRAPGFAGGNLPPGPRGKIGTR